MRTARSALAKGFSMVTAEQLIASARDLGPNGNFSWYKSEGTYFGDHHDLIAALQ